jgi:hypothetical protein
MNAPMNIDALIAQLPREISPPKAVWARIELAIAPAPRRYWPQALAAGIAIAALSATLTAAWIKRSGGEPPSGGATIALAFAEPQDPAYEQTRAALKQDFEERMVLLPPATRAQIRASLATIRHAETDIRRALEDNPANPVLGRLLQSTWNDELHLYADVVRDSQPVTTRTST